MEENRFYFAPLEGITGYLFRNAFHEFFGQGIEKYFTPFIATGQTVFTKSRVREDILPSHNEGIRVVPQILGNKGEDAAELIGQLYEYGYREINLNIGCPYQTVVSKKRGAGLLGEPELLEEYLDTIFQKKPEQVQISIKTRLGISSAGEFPQILRIYEKYPLAELIIHPRVREDFYGNHPELEAFEEAFMQCSFPVCYNGDLFSAGDLEQFIKTHEKVKRIMLGRGILANPGFLVNALTGQKTEKATVKAFHDRLYRDYLRVMSGEKNTLFKMKELWAYWQFLFAGGEKQLKRIRKATSASEYESAVEMIFGQCLFLPEGAFRME